MQIARIIWQLLASKAYRNYATLRWRRPPNLFQLSSVTRDNRYPALFQFARDELGDQPALRLLSFGCSTGDEVFALRRYFPQASIKGLDINRASIAGCNQRLRDNPDAAIDFEVADTTRHEPAQSCDAVFCLAVFRDGSLADPSIDRCDHRITFSRFSAAIDDISRCMKPGGLLFVSHSNFRVTDAPAAQHFDLVHRVSFPVGQTKVTPIFDVNNRRTMEVNCAEVVFRKKRIGP